MDDSLDLSDDVHNRNSAESHRNGDEGDCSSESDTTSSSGDDEVTCCIDDGNVYVIGGEETNSKNGDEVSNSGGDVFFHYRDGESLTNEEDGVDDSDEVESDNEDDIWDHDHSDVASDSQSDHRLYRNGDVLDTECGDENFNDGDLDGDVDGDIDSDDEGDIDSDVGGDVDSDDEGDAGGDCATYINSDDNVSGNSEAEEYNGMFDAVGSVFYNTPGIEGHSEHYRWEQEYVLRDPVSSCTAEDDSNQEQRSQIDENINTTCGVDKIDVFQFLEELHEVSGSESDITSECDDKKKEMTSSKMGGNLSRKSKLKLFFKRKKNRVHGEKKESSNTCENNIFTSKSSAPSSPSHVPSKSSSLPKMKNLQQSSKRKRLFNTMTHFPSHTSKRHKILMKIPGETPVCGVASTTSDSDPRNDDEVVIISCLPAVVLFTRRGKTLPVFRENDKGDQITFWHKGDTILDQRKIGAGRYPRKHGKKLFCLQGPRVPLFLEASPFHINRVLKKVKVTKRLESKDHVFYSFEGKNKNIQLASLILEALKARIKSYTVDLRSEFLEKQEFQLVMNGINSGEFQETVALFGKENNCLVSFDIDSKLFEPASLKWNSRHSKQADVRFIFDSSKVNHTRATFRKRTQDIGGYFWQLLKSELEIQFLYKDYFKHDTDNISPKFIRHIEKEAERNQLILKKESSGLVIMGKPHDVFEMMNFVHKSLSKPSLELSCAPARGTVDFLKFAAVCPISLPTYWRVGRFHGVDSLPKSTEPVLKTVGRRTKSAIQKLVNDTWSSHLVGNGRDARGLSHSNIRVTDVKRVENHFLFNAYSARRRQMFERKSAEQGVCTPVEQLRGSKGGVLTTEKIEGFMKRELYHEVNEHYMFHGTKQEAVPAIINTGLDPRVASSVCMWGSGVYAAENPTKSDQYTDDRHCGSNRSDKKILILARLLLGDIFVCDDSHPSLHSSQKLTRPPCMQCHKDKCLCPNQKLYDSIMADGKWLFREFVVYDKSQCYPEYVITYQRV